MIYQPRSLWNQDAPRRQPTNQTNQPTNHPIYPSASPNLQISLKSPKTKNFCPQFAKIFSGRAAVVPRMGVNPPPNPLGLATACQIIHLSLPNLCNYIPKSFAKIFCRVLCNLSVSSPGGPRIPPGCQIFAFGPSSFRVFVRS